MKRTFGSERGVALLAALGAIVLIGVIIAGVLFTVTQDYRISDNSLRQARATSTAELGLNRIIVDWNLADNPRLKTGDTLKRAFTASGGGISTVTVTRLPGLYFWAVSEGTSGTTRSSFLARRRYGLLLRLDIPQMNVMGAVTTQGTTTISGNVSVNGNDGAPASWASCSPGANVAGAAISPTTTATVNGSVTLNGNPPVLTTPAASDSNTYFNFGGQNYWSMAAAADLQYPGGTILNGVTPVSAGSVCVASLIPANWGEPNHVLPASPCESYFPVIHVSGDLKVTTGRGQGILLVDGDFTVAGNFLFTGVVIVRGALKMSGTGNKIVGAVLAATVAVDDNVSLSGNTSIQYSSCALISALSASAYPKAARQRGWVDVM
jgi:cytoskeletal protein CcmA (bactofilin family)